MIRTANWANRMRDLGIQVCARATALPQGWQSFALTEVNHGRVPGFRVPTVGFRRVPTTEVNHGRVPTGSDDSIELPFWYNITEPDGPERSIFIPSISTPDGSVNRIARDEPVGAAVKFVSI